MVFYGGRRRTHVLESASSFAKLHLSDAVRRALLLAGYRRPSRLQEKAIPLARSGRNLIVRTESDEEKTLVFALTCLDRVDAASCYSQVLILTPNGNKAKHCASEIQKVASNLPYPHLSCGVFTETSTKSEDRRQLRFPCHVIVSTPGRLEKLRRRGALCLNRIRLVVMDDVDRLYVDRDDLFSILSHLPEGRQSLAFASRYAPDLLEEIKGTMVDPLRLFVDEISNPGDRHCSRIVEGGLKVQIQTMVDFLNRSMIHEAIVFCNDQAAVDCASSVLEDGGYRREASMHSPERSSSDIKYVEEGQGRRIVLSMDGHPMDVVIHIGCPINAATYHRRVGRTDGIDRTLSVAFVSESEQKQLQEWVEGTDCRLIELPEEMPMDWCNDHDVRESIPSSDENNESPKLPQELSWTGGSKSEFLAMTERLEKRYPCCHHWDPSSISRPSSREGPLRFHGEGHHDLGIHHRRVNCIRLPSRMSRSTSASSVVYSEEGECECLDEDVWSTDRVDQLPLPPPLQPPEMPPEMSSVSDFESVRDRYTEWRKAYAEWRGHYEAWYKTIQLMPHQLPSV